MRLQRRTLLAAAAASLAAPALAEAGRFAAAARYSAERRGVSLMVLREGRTLFEDYPNEGAPDRAFELASGTKSFCGPLLAAAASEGLLDPGEPCAAVLPEWRNDPRRSRITPLALLTLTGGFAGGLLRPPGYTEAVAAPLASAPGERFAYGPIPFQIFGEMLRRRLSARRLPPDPVAYLQSRLLDRLSVRPGAWRRGRDGNPLLPQGAAFTARGWGAFGEAIRRAETEPQRGLDAGVVAALFRGTRANPGYGLTWWLAEPGLIAPGRRQGLEGLPLDRLAAERIAFAAGAGHQRLYLLRARGVVVVRQASGIAAALAGRGPDWNDAAFLGLLQQAL
jgi:CubicO group peptidase (beta-lactamase class C family)